MVLMGATLTEWLGAFLELTRLNPLASRELVIGEGLGLDRLVVAMVLCGPLFFMMRALGEAALSPLASRAAAKRIALDRQDEEPAKASEAETGEATGKSGGGEPMT